MVNPAKAADVSKAPKQASKPMQFINSFVSAVANGAMLIMSSTSSNTVGAAHPKNPPVPVQPRADPKQENDSKTFISKINSKQSVQKNEPDQLAEAVAQLAKPPEEPAPVAAAVPDQPYVNKKTNRKSYSEVILTESTYADLKHKPKSLSLNNFQTRPACVSTMAQARPNASGNAFNANNRTRSFNNNNNNNTNNNNSSHNNKNRHSTCLSTPNSNKNSTINDQVIYTGNSFNKNLSKNVTTTSNNKNIGSKSKFKPINNNNNKKK